LFLWLIHRESYNGIAYNTDLIAPARAPRKIRGPAHGGSADERGAVACGQERAPPTYGLLLANFILSPRGQKIFNFDFADPAKDIPFNRLSRGLSSARYNDQIN
jgi:hypothetical protein